MNKLFINTILLGGSTVEKIDAAAAAGFSEIELWRQDVEQFSEGKERRESERQIKEILKEKHIGLTDYQVLLDFDGAPENKRAAKRAEALALLDTAVGVGAHTVLVPASTDFSCNPDLIVSDMRWLAREAAQRGLRVAHEGMAWSTVNHSLPAVWEVVQKVDEPNLGLVVDAFHIFARGRNASDLTGIPLDRIFLVQLSDLDQETNPSNIVQIARHSRLLPGQGRFPLHTIIERLEGYKGPIGLEVFNDEMKSKNPDQTARAAMTALKQTLGVRITESA